VWQKALHGEYNMNSNGIEVCITVAGKPVAEYDLNKDGVFKKYIEGRAGTDYEIRIRNNTSGRVEAVISVDGLSITTGEAAGSKSTGYVIRPYGTTSIPGFLVNGAKAAQFTFGSPKASYAAQSSGGDTSNVGVIGVLVYREHHYQPPIAPRRMPLLANPPSKLLADRVTMQNGLGSRDEGTRGAASFSAGAPVKQGLGTEFGAAVDFKTNTVHFTRAELLTTIAIHYDDIRGLEQRGVVIPHRVPRYVEHTPNPFPAGIGCKPPAGWSA
jgi:hypothetical protein